LGEKGKRKRERKRAEKKFVKTNVFEIFLLSRRNATNHETVKIALAALYLASAGWKDLTILHSEIYTSDKTHISSTKTSKFHSRRRG
jgi:hypothetical protein